MTQQPKWLEECIERHMLFRATHFNGVDLEMEELIEACMDRERLLEAVEKYREDLDTLKLIMEGIEDMESLSKIIEKSLNWQPGEE